MKSYKLIIEDKLMKRIKQNCLDNDKSIKQFLIEAIKLKFKYDDKTSNN